MTALKTLSTVSHSQVVRTIDLGPFMLIYSTNMVYYARVQIYYIVLFICWSGSTRVSNLEFYPGFSRQLCLVRGHSQCCCHCSRNILSTLLVGSWLWCNLEIQWTFWLIGYSGPTPTLTSESGYFALYCIVGKTIFSCRVVLKLFLYMIFFLFLFFWKYLNRVILSNFI